VYIQHPCLASRRGHRHHLLSGLSVDRASVSALDIMTFRLTAPHGTRDKSTRTRASCKLWNEIRTTYSTRPWQKYYIGSTGTCCSLS
jgi:hypothetical protein